MSDPYDAAFYDIIRDGCLRSARRVVPLVLAAVHASRVVDVGCGEGAWLSVFKEAGCTVRGVDGDYVDRRRLLIDEDEFVGHDLTEGFDLGRFDLAVCLEVAEHLEAPFADQLVATLVRHAPVVLFSAAIPGQGGVGHVNEQWPAFWVEKFNALWVHSHGRAALAAVGRPGRRELVCAEPDAVRRRVAHQMSVRLRALLDSPLAPMWPVVHPVLWDSRR
jgi:SAM-dependent methyltransferase